MRQGSYCNILERKKQENETFEVLSCYFKTPLPNFFNMNKDPIELKDMILKTLETEHEKANNLLKVTIGIQNLCQNYFKSAKELELYKELNEFKVEQQGHLIEEYAKEINHKAKRIDELTSDIDELEKALHTYIQEKDQRKMEIQTLKRTLKQKELDFEELLQIEHKKYQKKADEDSKKSEMLQNGLMHNYITIEKLNGKLQILEKELRKEKGVNDKSRACISSLKSEMFEIKTKLREAKIKKSNYKALYKETIETSRGIPKCRHISTQTVSEDNDEDVKTESNELSFQFEDENALLNLKRNSFQKSHMTSLFHVQVKTFLHFIPINRMATMKA